MEIYKEEAIARRVAADVEDDRVAADLKTMFKKEIEESNGGMEELIKRLEKTHKTLNPQDPEKVELEKYIKDLKKVFGIWENIVDSIDIQF